LGEAVGVTKNQNYAFTASLIIQAV
jgi:hypothetical protein